MPSEAARPVVPVTHDPRTPVAVPPARWYRLADGRTLGWGGRTWEGYWKYGDAVFADKLNGKQKPVAADFVGLTVPDRFVFGFGMDAGGAWRNLPAIYAMKEEA